MLNSKYANDENCVNAPVAGNDRGTLNRKMEAEVKFTLGEREPFVFSNRYE